MNARTMPQMAPVSKQVHAQQVYYVSNRPEAYEIWGEVSHDDADSISRMIATFAGRRFPHMEFRIDGDWHVHEPGMEPVSAYIEKQLPGWIDKALAR